MAGDRKIYRLKVTLRSSKPPIWRRIKVYEDISLQELHTVLQVAMGWMNCHLHQFIRGNVFYGPPDPDFGFECESEVKTRLHDVLHSPKDKMIYEYDFGDSWKHQVVLEAVEEPAQGVNYPVVVAGKRACPPEDVGGIYGYYDFLAALADPEHPEHEDMREWLGEPFDPDFFDLESINEMLLSLFKKPGKRRR